MALKDQAINLVLRARNLLSGDADAAARSVDDLADSAEGLEGKLRQLEDQKGLTREFAAASKAVERTGNAYDRLKAKADKMAAKLEKSGEATAEQTREWYDLQDAVGKAEQAHNKAEGTLEELGREAEAAGVNIRDLGESQRENARETLKAKRAQADLNKTVAESDGKFKGFRQTLSKGVITFGAWASAAAAAGAALAVGALTRFTSSQADLARQTLASAEAFGVSAVELQKWQYAAEEVGIGGEKVADIMKDTAEKIGDAYLTGGGEAREVIQGLGLDLEKLANMRPDEQILAIAAELEGMPKPGQIQILEALASDASLLLPLLDDNAAKLRELGNAAEERGAIFTEDELKQLAEVDRAFRDITTRVSGFGKEIVIKLAPAFKKMATAIDEALADKPELVDSIAEAFTGLIETTGEWVEYIIKKRDEIGNSFRGIGYTVEGVKQSFIALFRGVQSFGAGAAEVAARLVYTWNNAGLAILELRNKIGLATDEAVAAARYAVENAAQSVADLKKQSEDYQNQMIAAGSAAATAFGKAATGAGEAARQVAKTVGEVVQLNDAAEKAEGSTKGLGEQLADLASEQESVKTRIEETAVALEAAGVALANNDTEENRQQVARLRAEYEALIQTLNQLQETEQNLANPTNTSDSGGSGGGGGTGNALADKYKEAAGAIKDTGTQAKKTYSQVVVMGQGIKDSGEQVKKAGAAAVSAASGAGRAIGAIFDGWTGHLAALSTKAAAAFKDALGYNKGGAKYASELEAKLATVNNRLQDMNGRLKGMGVAGLLRDWAKAGFETEKSFLEQAIAVEKLTDKILAGDRSARVLQMSAEDVGRQFNLLDDNQLRPLIGAIQSARREVESLNDSLMDTIASTRQELAALSGDTAEVERLRNQERMFELEQQLTQARALGDKETEKNALEAIRLTEKAYQLRKKQAEEQEREAKARALEYEKRAADERIRDEREERQDISRVEQRTQTQVTQLDRAIQNRTVTLNFADNGRSLGSVAGIDSNQIDNLIDALEAAGYLTTG